MTTIRVLWAMHLGDCATCAGVVALDERPTGLCAAGQKIYVRAAFALARGDEKAAERPSLRDFDGATYDPELDRKRLGAQLLRVRGLMGDGRWRTLAGIALALGDPQASISARLRDLRKPKFGGGEVLRRRLGDPKRGIWEYRVKKPKRDRPKPVQGDLFR